jgi:hypothetical protein
MPSELRSPATAHVLANAIGRGLLLIVVAPLIGPGGYNIFGRAQLEDTDLAVD